MVLRDGLILWEKGREGGREGGRRGGGEVKCGNQGTTRKKKKKASGHKAKWDTHTATTSF
jgi:hypothetical protein